MSSAKKTRSCRAFRQRTIGTVRQAINDWGYIFGLSPPEWECAEEMSCLEVASSVKRLLSSEVSTSWEEQFAFQSIKKILPDSCKCMESGLLDALVEKIRSPALRLPPNYLQFVRSQVRRLFPKGWDSDYESYVRLTSPPLTSTTGSSRAKGGSLADLSGHHEEFLNGTLRNDGIVPDELGGELLVVQSSGKPRPLTKFDPESLMLRPLHKMIYDRLSKQRWLLRGPPNLAACRKAGFKESKGGKLASGDYKSATDNLPIEVMEVALETILEYAFNLPAGLKKYAMKSCRPLLLFNDIEFSPTRGQMMGSYLSFPFLCLQNYLAFQWSMRATKKNVPVLINGDDILFQAEDADIDRWMETVGRLGLEVEKTKTSVDAVNGSLNSTLLRWKDGELAIVPTLRFGSLRKTDQVNSLGRSYGNWLAGIEGQVRYRAGRVFFEHHLGALKNAAVLPASLGFRGLLAARLSKKFRLHVLPARTLPEYPTLHSTVYSRDAVLEVPVELLLDDMRKDACAELAAAKWASQFEPKDAHPTIIRWCIERSMSCRRWDEGSVDLRPFWADEWEMEYLMRIKYDEVMSRRAILKEFCQPSPVRERMMFVPWSWFQQSCDIDFGRGSLPSYEMACAESGNYIVT